MVLNFLCSNFCAKLMCLSVSISPAHVCIYKQIIRSYMHYTIINLLELYSYLIWSVIVYHTIAMDRVAFLAVEYPCVSIKINHIFLFNLFLVSISVVSSPRVHLSIIVLVDDPTGFKSIGGTDYTNLCTLGTSFCQYMYVYVCLIMLHLCRTYKILYISSGINLLPYSAKL